MATRGLGALTIDFILKTGGFEQGMDRASKITQSETKKIQRNVTIAAGAISAFAATFQTMAVAAFNSTASVVDNTAKMARQIGVTTEALTSMRFATQEFVNISEGNFDLSMRRMTRRISEAAEGSGAAKKALDSMGVSAKELATMTPDQQFYRIADAMKDIGSRGDQLRYTMAIFDTQGMPLVDALIQGSGALREMADQADRFGALIKDVDAQAMEDAVSAVSRMQSTFSGFKNEVAFAMAPIVEEMANSFTELVRSIEIDGDTIKAVFRGIGTVAVGAAAVVATQAVPSMIASVAKLSAVLAALPIGWVAATLATAGLAMAAFSGKITLSSQAMDTLKAAATSSRKSVTELISALTIDNLDLSGPWVELGESVEKAIEYANRYIDYFVQINVGSMLVIAEVFRTGMHNVGAIITNTFIGAARVVTDFIDGVSSLLSSLGVDVETNLSEMLNGAQVEMLDFGARVEAAWHKGRIANFSANHELEKTLNMLDDFMNTPAAASAQDLADSLGDGGGGRGGVSKNAKKAADEIKNLLDQLFPVMAAGEALSKNTKLLSSAMKKGLIDADMYAKGMHQLNKEYKDVIAASQPHIKAISDQATALQSSNKALADQIKAFGETDISLARNALAETEARIAVLEGIKATEKARGAKSLYIKEIQAEIDALEDLAIAQGHSVGLLEQSAAQESVQAMADESKKFADDLEGWLIGAFDRSFDRGESLIKSIGSTLKNYFSNLILRPIIQPIAAGVAGALGVPGAANAAQGGGLGGLFSGSGFSPFTGFSGSLSGAVDSIGGTLSSLGGKVGDFGANLVMNADTIGATLDKLGAGFSYATAVFQLAQGKAGAGLGIAAGQFLGGPIGAAIGSAVGSFLDKKFAGETRFGGGFHYDPASDSTRFGAGPSGGYGGSLGAVDHLLRSQHNAIRDVLDAVGATNIQIGKVVGSFESSDKNRGGTSSGGSLIINGQEVFFGSLDASGQLLKGAGFGGRSGTSEEMFANLQKEIHFSALEAWKAVGDEMPNVIRSMLDGIDIRALTAEQAEGAVNEIQSIVVAVNELIGALNSLPFYNLQELSFDLAASLQQAAGGIDNLLGSVSDFYQGFYSEQERMAIGVEEFLGHFLSLGVALPTSAKGFRDLVNSIEIVDDASAQLYASLVGLSGAASEFYSAVESQMNAAIEESAAYYESLRSQAQDSLKKRNKQINDAYRSQTKYIAERFNAMSSNIRDNISLVNDKLKELERIVSAVESSINSLQSMSDSAQAIIRENARSTINAALAMGRAGQSLVGFDGLEEAVKAVGALTTDAYSSFADLERERLTTLHDLAELSGYAEDQVDVQELQLNALEQQLDSLNEWRNAQLSQAESLRDRQLEAAQVAHDNLIEKITEVEQKERALIETQHAEAMYEYVHGNEILLQQLGMSGLQTQSVIHAIGSGDRDIVAAIRSIDMRPIVNVTTVSPQIPAYATGGIHHTEGLAMFGEKGPEIGMVGPTRFFNANQTQDMIKRAISSNQSEIKELSDDMSDGLHSLGAIIDKMGVILDRWDKFGLPETNEEQV